MTFNDIVTEIKERLNLTSATATTRVGRLVNICYKRVTSSIGLRTSRFGTVSANMSIGSADVTFAGVEKVERVWVTSGGSISRLREVTPETLRNTDTVSGTTPRQFAVINQTSDTVTIRLDIQAEAANAIYADAHVVASTLSGTDEPAFPESFHDVLVEGVLADELRKINQPQLARISQQLYKERLSDLQHWMGKSAFLTIMQGGDPDQGTSSGLSGASGGSSGGIGSTTYTITAAWTFDRDPSAPFIVTDGSAYVANLFSEGVGNVTTDRLIGRDTAGTGESEQLTVGGGLEFTGSGGIQTSALTGDVTKSAGGTVLTIAVDAVTYAKMQNVSAASRLLGRGSSGGSGNVEEISFGSTLTLSGTTLSVTIDDENSILAVQIFS